MPNRYFDTSVVVAYYLPEENSAAVQSIYEDADEPEISTLVQLEFFAAVSLRVRIGDLSHEEAEEVSTIFDAHLRDGLYGRRHLEAGHYRLARDYIARFDLPLKAPDALHLALCSAEDLTLLTADRQLARNAEALDVRTELVSR
ncbi:MAG: type II toxin-antitoxin system VapC family toxin [Actinomycetota bacterium]|nr:type II toxin-antitoxin system VapC family toxin [Actinomycetota bacterium]